MIMKNQRIISLDIAKAICIVLVVIGHCLPENAPNWYQQIVDFIYKFHMPLFMFASGYIYMATLKPELGYRDFVIKKFNRIMIPYFAISIIIIGLKLLGNNFLYVHSPVSWKAFIGMLYYPTAGFFLWFCWALFIIFIIIRLCNSNKIRFHILFCISLILYFLPIKLPEIFCLSRIQMMFIYFMLGIEAVIFKDKIKNITNSPAGYAIIYLILIYLYAVTEYHNNIINLLAGIVGVYSICTIAKHISIQKGKTINALISLASCSYTIYLLHTTFEGTVRAVLLKAGMSESTTTGFIISTVVIVTSGIVIPYWLHYKVIIKYRFTRLIFGINN